ncbi:MAG TPA: electron transfer flavoprotein subunit beta/FixA family protein [Planctomycetota bacterium]|nr:electron transfer flavoprotein subunit beta/FixA family protein [Planctomycetota bacterium]
MNIIVCLKRVPHTASKIRLAAAPSGASSKSIDVQGIEFTLSPYDEIALAEAVRLKTAAGAQGSVVVLTVGGDETQPVLRTALAMGADSALQVRGNAPTGLELDGFQVASLIAGALRGRDFDLLLFGRLATDDQSAQVGTLAARLLGLPSVADVSRIEVQDGNARLHHLVNGRVEVVECKLPAAATAQKGLAEPPYPSVKQILAAKKKPIEVLTGELPEPTLETLALEPPPPRKPGRIVGQGVAAVPELVRLLREEAKVIG